MLKLSDVQWEKLQARDTHQFLIAVCDQFFATRPDITDGHRRAAVLERMRAAHGYAVRIKLVSTPHIVRLLYLAADAPGVHDDPMIDSYLRKPGATPEQRLDDLIAAVMKKLVGGH